MVEKRILDVLIIDKSAELGDRVLMMLKESGELIIDGRVIECEKAFQYLKENTPGMIILDIDCPANLWIKIILQINLAQVSTPLIIFTNRSDSYYRNFCRLLGVSSFLDKTTEFDCLPGLINSLFSNSINK